MAYIHDADLIRANEWKAFCERIGWTFVKCDLFGLMCFYETGELHTKGKKQGQPIEREFHLRDRERIEATWRDQSNVENIRSGTDG